MRKIPKTGAERSRPPALSRDAFGFTAPLDEEPERLVGLGFRYWTLGRQTGNIACWERAWTLYSGAFGVAAGRVAITQLSTWVGALGSNPCRTIEVADRRCSKFCRDECIAISLIAACQHRTCPALRACAFALVETSQIDGLINGAQDFADTLLSMDHVLSPKSIVRAPVDFTIREMVAH